MAVYGFCLYAEVLHKQPKRSFGHIRKQQGNELACSGIDSRIQVGKLVAQLYFADRPATFGSPPLFALRAGAAAHLIFQVDALVVAVF
jgi:hypothetical protein